MKKPKVTKIEPFFRGLTPKMRLIVYLLGTGAFTLGALRKLTVAEFSALNLPSILPASLELYDICREITAGRGGDETAFCNTSGRTYSIKDLTEVLKRSHKIAGVPYAGLENFISLVN